MTLHDFGGFNMAQRSESRAYVNVTNSDVTGSDVMGSDVTPADTEHPYHYAGAAGLLVFRDWYREWHGYLATSVCLFGIIANLFNIVVLTRRAMLSPTNCLLTGLAVSDGLTMAAYLPFALRFYVLRDGGPDEGNTLGAARFLLLYACFSVVVHTVAIWLTVLLAVFRYICVKHPRYSSVWCSLARAKLTLLLVSLLTVLICIPNFVSITVQQVPDNNGTAWAVAFKEATPTDQAVKSLNFWIQAVLVKIVPCTALTLLSVLLVQTMKQAEKRRQKLRGASRAPKATQCDEEEKDLKPALATGSAPGGGSASKDPRKTNRTTRMLLVVVVLFLVTELPQGVLNLLSGVLKPSFVTEVYTPLGDLLDIVTLVNSAINFVLYCAMSRQFRETFVSVVLACCCMTSPCSRDALQPMAAAV